MSGFSASAFGAALQRILPSISGAKRVGGVLVCSPGAYVAPAYQWTRDGAAIPGATSNTYTLTTADYETAISCQVTSSTLWANNEVMITPPVFVGVEISSYTKGEQNFVRVPDSNPKPYNLREGTFDGRPAIAIEGRPGDKNGSDTAPVVRAGLDGFVATFDGINRLIHTKFEVVPNPQITPPLAQQTSDWWTIFEEHGFIFPLDTGVGGSVQITNEWRGGSAKTCVIRKTPTYNATTGFMTGVYALTYLYESASEPWGVWEVWIKESGARVDDGIIRVERDGVQVVNFTGKVGFSSTSSATGFKERSRSYRQIRAYQNDKGYDTGFLLFTDTFVCDSAPFNPTAGSSAANWTPANMPAGMVLYNGPASGLNAASIASNDNRLGVICSATLPSGAGDHTLITSSASGGFSLKARNNSASQLAVLNIWATPSTIRSGPNSGTLDLRKPAGTPAVYSAVQAWGATNGEASSPRGLYNIHGYQVDADRSVTATYLATSGVLQQAAALANDDIVIVTTGMVARADLHKLVAYIAWEKGLQTTLSDASPYKTERPRIS